MKGQNLMKSMSFIKQKYIHEGEFESLGASEKSTFSYKKLAALILAACLVLSLAATAYAVNMFGIRELFRTDSRELPAAADPFIRQENAAAKTESGWSCVLTESLCDSSTVMATVAIRGGSQYIVAPTDADPDDPVNTIGIDGDQSLAEYADSQGKKLLLVGAVIAKVGDEEVGSSSQTVKSISDSEMVILTESDKTVSAPDLNAVCLVYALEAGSDNVQRKELPFTLTEAPSVNGEVVYRPLKPDTIPGMTVGDMNVTETPLGINIRILETVTETEAYYNIMKVDIEGLTCGGSSGSVLKDDGNWYFEANMCRGTPGDRLTVRYYDPDKQLIGEIEFQKADS